MAGEHRGDNRAYIEGVLGIRPGSIAAAEVADAAQAALTASPDQASRDRALIERSLGLPPGALSPVLAAFAALNGQTIAALGGTITAPQSGQLVQLLPAGSFQARDGRPGPGRSWKLPDVKGMFIAAALQAVIASTPIVIDYEHQTLRKEANGQPAPAAGWIKRVTWLTGKGLMAEVEWTPRARAAIAAGEYRYISPVISFDEKTDEVTGMVMAALTNYPALLGMQAVQV